MCLLLSDAEAGIKYLTIYETVICGRKYKNRATNTHRFMKKRQVVAIVGWRFQYNDG